MLTSTIASLVRVNFVLISLLYHSEKTLIFFRHLCNEKYNFAFTLYCKFSVIIYSTQKAKKCDDYNHTTSAEMSDGDDEEEELQKRKPKKKNYADFVTGTCYYLLIRKKILWTLLYRNV